MLAFISFVSLLLPNGSSTTNQQTANCTLPSAVSYWYQVDYKTFYQLLEVHEEINWSSPKIILLEAAVYQCTNEQREKYSRTFFSYAHDLNQSATYHSASMATRNYFNHENSFEKSMKTFVLRMKYFGAAFYSCGENIAYSEYDSGTYLSVAKDIVRLWMESEGHRHNILSSDYKEIGCGISIRKMTYWYRVYATQDFGGKRFVKN